MKPTKPTKPTECVFWAVSPQQQMMMVGGEVTRDISEFDELAHTSAMP